jgi:hypothetical protein
MVAPTVGSGGVCVRRFAKDKAAMNYISVHHKQGYSKAYSRRL